jgi:hypothetical protein
MMTKTFKPILTAAIVVAAGALQAGAANAASTATGRSQQPAADQTTADHIYVSNGSFDWRHRRHGQQVPWYAYGINSNCFAWTPNAYHYACDPNSRY